MKPTIRSLMLALAAAQMGTAAVAQETVELLVWSGPVRLPFYEAFDASRDDVSLDHVTVATNEIITKLQLALRTGEGIPDAVFLPDTNFAAQLSTRRANYLMELSGKVDQSTLDGFYANANSLCEKGEDSLVCLRNDVAHFVLWYNKSLMDELGLEVPTTWEEYEQVAAAAAAGESGIVSGAVAMHIPLMNFLYSNNCDLAVPVADEPNTLKINMSAPQCVEAAQLVDRMLDDGSLARVSPFDPEFVGYAKAGKVLMIPGPTWFGEYVIRGNYEIAPDTFGVAMTPRWESQDVPLVWSWGGGTWGGWIGTEHPEQVLDLLTYVTTDKTVNSTALTMPAYQPASVAWGEALTESGYLANNDAFEIMVEAATFSHPGYTSLRFDARSSFTKAVVNDLASGASFESLLPQLQDEFVNAARLAGYDVVTD